MDFSGILKTICPTVASALLGPLGGIAVSAIGSIIGIDEPTQDKISKAFKEQQLTGDQILQIKALELQYQNDEKERGFKYAELEFKDIDSARNREIQTGDQTNKTLAFIIVGAFIAMVGCTLAGYAKVDTVLAGTLIGYLSAKCEQVLAYYFGSSQGSKEKTALLAKAEPIK